MHRIPKWQEGQIQYVDLDYYILMSLFHFGGSAIICET